MILVSDCIAATDDRPNIIFILADDWGWGDLGCYGNKEIRTPNLDGLAKDGILFEQFYVASAVCSPSRASFMTGLFTNRHGIHSHLAEMKRNRLRGLPLYLDPELPMLPKLLHDAGYAIAHFGKWHLCSADDPNAPPPSKYGFDLNRIVGGEGDGIQQLPPGLDGFSFWEDARPGPNWSKWRARSSELIIDETIGFIQENKDKPFFVQAWLFDTHAMLTPTDEQMEPFKNLGMPFRIYFGAVMDSDRHIGRLLKKLDELGLTENTIVMFSSDNGPEDIAIDNAQNHGVGDPGPFRGRKRSGYEGGIRMPLIVRWPAQIVGGQINRSTIISAVDFLPTICSLAGVQVPDDIDGEDMSEVLHGNPIQRKGPLFWDMRVPVVGPAINRSPQLIIRDGNWKLLMNRDGTGIELYDITSSPLEVDNTADGHPDVAKRLSERLLKWSRQED